MNMTERKQELCRRAVELMMCTDRRHRTLCDGRFSAIGMHRAQHRMLMFLHHKGGAESQRAISKELNISTAVVTVTLQGLEADGYVKREIDENDKRNYRITLTEAGCEIVAKTREIARGIDETMFEGFSEEELEQYIALTARIRENIKKEMEGTCDEKMV